MGGLGRPDEAQDSMEVAGEQSIVPTLMDNGLYEAIGMKGTVVSWKSWQIMGFGRMRCAELTLAFMCVSGATAWSSSHDPASCAQS